MIAMNTEPQMTEFEEKAHEFLVNCEVSVRKQAGEALTAGSYREAEKLAKIAEKVKQMYSTLGSDAVLPDFDARQNFVSESPESRYSPAGPQTNAPVSRSKKRGRKSKYPRFEVDGNHLIKTSWSKTKKAEYVHKAPRKVLNKLIETFLAMGSRKQIIATEKMFPLSDQGTNFPDYQSYLCLLWMKQNKLVIHHGREGYQVRDPKTFAQHCEQLWEQFDA